ncbi:glutaminase [Kribbella sp. NPDC051620]|uniref:glutaminase n=1 Tax=Kribbella sp. NPDC051620 TaxID=3364120 RepID=UPI00378C7BFF
MAVAYRRRALSAPIRYQEVLARSAEAASSVAGVGTVAHHIPALALVDADSFGMAVATVDGDIYTIGAAEEPFSIQSLSKLFALALVMSLDGEAIWERVGREPSGSPFNSLTQLEAENGRPRNPMINAGAIVVTDRLQELTGDASETVRRLICSQAGNAGLDTNPAVAASEAQHGHRNAALGHLIAGHGNLVHDVDTVLTHYYAQCAIEASCRDLVLASSFLARQGVRRDGGHLLSPRQAKRLNSVLLTCGTYDAAGDFAYRVGLPGKSGVGGGVLAIVPGHAAICAWSPRLDRAGNSVAGVAALDAFTTASGLSVF